jgi:hypothetical protein
VARVDDSPSRALLGILAAVTLAACSAESTKGSPIYLCVWAGPNAMDTTGPSHHGSAGTTHDFAAVLDADPASPKYGSLLASVDAGAPGQMAHHTEITLPGDRLLFANDFMAGKIFLLDLANRLAPRVVRRIDSIPGYRQPHSFVRLPSGNVIASLQFGNGSIPGDPGGLAEFDPSGQLVRTVSSADSAFPRARIRTYGVTALPAIDRLVTTSSPMDTERVADVVQIWRLSDLKLLRTLATPPLAGDSVQQLPFEVRPLADGRSAFLNTYYCGFYLLTNLESDAPQIRLVHSLPGRVGCSVPTIVGNRWVMPVAYDHSVVALDLTDPAHPVESSVLRSDSTFLPHWSSADAAGDRIVIVGQDDGEARVMMARLDRATGKLSWDERFRDSGSTRAGVSFARTSWPHGTVPNAMPHGAIFSR